VHGLRGNTSLADRVEWDNYYIENWSLWLDVKIMLMTFTAVLHHRGEARCLRFPQQVAGRFRFNVRTRTI
jgi:hypothetical protein